MVPTCFCDDTHNYQAYPSITQEQALCKELIPSVAYINHHSGNFSVNAATGQLQLNIDEWAVHTLTIKDEWNVLYVNLSSSSELGDPMVIVRQGKNPSFDLYPPVPIQHIDSAAWTQNSLEQRILLSRGSSTLSTGTYYIAVYNTRYSRQKLNYELGVSVYTTDGCGSFICSGRGTCNADASITPTCTCDVGFTGLYCDIIAQHFTVNAGDLDGVRSSITVPLQLMPLTMNEGAWKVWIE